MTAGIRGEVFNSGRFFRVKGAQFNTLKRPNSAGLGMGGLGTELEAAGLEASSGDGGPAGRRGVKRSDGDKTDSKPDTMAG